MNNIDLMNYWIESSDEDYNVMNVLHNSKKNSYCLFFGQMVIEKLLKALYAKNNKGAPYAPKTHDLLYLAQKYVQKVCENYKIKAIILFGSYAKGTEHEDSDIDIAVITDDIKTDTFDEEVKLMILRKGIDYRIEPHIITVADYENDETPFVVEVKNTGIKVA